MSFWNSRTVSKTRKQYRCELCRAKIEIGTSCQHESGIFEGEFQDYRLCHRCHALLLHGDPWLDEWDNTIGDFADCLFGGDYCRCPKCNQLSWREYDFSDDMMSVTMECDNCDHFYTVDLSADTLLGRKEATP